MAKKFKLTLKRGLPGKTDRQRKTIHSLGLFKTNQTVEMEDSPVLRGKLTQVGHLLSIVES